MEISTFNPDGNVLPALGRTFSDLKRHHIQSPYAEIGGDSVDNRRSQQEEFYETIHDDGYHFDVEEVQRTPTVDLVDKTEEKSIAENPLYEKLNLP